MKIVKYTQGRLLRMPRPPEYLEEMKAIRVAERGSFWMFDADSEGFKALQDKYRNYIPPNMSGAIVLPKKRIKYEKRGTPTLKQAVSFARAAATVPYVRHSLTVLRNQVCVDAPCEHIREDENGHYCNMCKCGVSDKDRHLTNLASYTEILPKTGCKHPERGMRGKGWPVDCANWSPSGEAGYGYCALGLHGGRPHIAVCASDICPQRVEDHDLA